jgi:hypothetical protein
MAAPTKVIDLPNLNQLATSKLTRMLQGDASSAHADGN